ncbi:MAG: carbon-nitrogen hydrolase family protein [Sinobacteraceae bacterium]|nr:carbon-nitrogen hydrolase family protein [Nevskiaceae bacterium]
MSRFNLALAQFGVYAPRSWSEVEARLAREVTTAAGQGAKLLVFPEYAAMTLAALLPPAVQGDLRGQIAHLQRFREDYLSLHRRLAREHGVYLLAGSFPWEVAPGRFRNRAFLCPPHEGRADYQDKRVMTRFEREAWNIEGGAEIPLKVFDTALGALAIDICYDVEFPALAAAQADTGAALILVPSCTDTLAGHHRVHVAARARALENQCLVAVAPLVGAAPWSPAIDVNRGAAALYGPPDRGFPDDGLLACGTLDQPGWVYAEVDLARVAQVRTEGQVFNFRHGREPAAGPAIVERRSL